MATAWRVRVFDQRQLKFTGECFGPLELGRKQSVGEPLFAVSEVEDAVTGRRIWRLPIAAHDEDRIGRHHALIEPLGPGRARVENRSQRAFLGVENRADLRPGESCEVTLPTLLLFSRKAVRIAEVLAEGEGPGVGGVPESAPATVLPAATPPRVPIGHGGAGLVEPAAATDTSRLVRALQAVLGVAQTAASDAEFFQKTARAVVEVAGLDVGRVLLWWQDEWKTVASFTTSEAADIRAGALGQAVLERMRREERTCWQWPTPLELERAGSAGLAAVVAAPILDLSGAVTGALYGERRQVGLGPAARPITEHDAALIDLLAGGVTAGLARLEQERTAVTAQVRLEPFFGPVLARQVAARPELLISREREITLLVCGLSGFREVARGLGPARALEWLGDVLTALSDCVFERQGVLAEYHEASLLAFWGAPEAQPDHPKRACLAALGMLQKLPELHARWGAALGRPTVLEIALDTGPAQVGNIGTVQKFQYGAVGEIVHQVRQLRRANREFRTAMVLTRATRDRLGRSFAARRLGAVQFEPLSDPVELFDLAPADRSGWEALRRGYEAVASEFEAGNFRTAMHLIARLVPDYPGDGPLMRLAARAAACLVEAPEPFDPTFRF